MSSVREQVQRLWDVSPKTLKVFGYIALSAALEGIARELNADLFAFLPEIYRVAAYNLAVVLLVEVAKKLKESAK